MAKATTSRTRTQRLVLLLAALCVSSAAAAHHSFALFDRTNVTTLTGTVQDWKWGNPHTWLMMVVSKPDGKTEDWSLVGSSPNMMSRWGWNAADIKDGDKIQVDIFPARDGRHIGSMKTLFLGNGKVLADPAGQPGGALASGPADVPTKPQGRPYQ